MIKNLKWNEIQWKVVSAQIYDLQYKIYCHANNNQQHDMVRHYQHKLVKSQEARLLAVRAVTQDNRGKATAGIDRKAKLTPEQRLVLARKLVLDGKASKIRRVYIQNLMENYVPWAFQRLKIERNKC